MAPPDRIAAPDGTGSAGRRWLLLHGVPLNPAAWEGVVAALPPEDQVLAPILATTQAADHLQAALAQSLAEQLASDDGPFDVVGHSFGGQVALEFALLVPARVRSLTVLCSRDTPFAPFDALAAAIRQGQPLAVEAILQRWFRPQELQANGAAVANARRCLQTVDPAAYANALAAIASYDAVDQRAALRMPVTLVAAENDTVATPAVMAAWAAALPAARYCRLPGAAHMSPLVEPARWLSLLQASG